MDKLIALIAVFAFPFIAESMTEYFFDMWMPKKFIRYVSAAVGILLAVLWRVNIPRDLMAVEAILPWAGEILTGLVIGRGANFVHDFGNVQQGLRWNASDVETHPSELLIALDQRDLHSEIGRAERCRITSRASAEHHDLGV